MDPSRSLAPGPNGRCKQVDYVSDPVLNTLQGLSHLILATLSVVDWRKEWGKKEVQRPKVYGLIGWNREKSSILWGSNWVNSDVTYRHRDK